MTTISHEPSAARERPAWFAVRDMWVSLAIGVIWLAVSLTAVFGADLTSTDVAGNSTTIPSGVIVALFAVLASFGVAKYGFGEKTNGS